MSIRFKPILGGAFYPFWEGLRVSLVQMGALSRTKVDEWTTLTCNPDILSSWNLKYSQFLSIRDSLKEKPSVGYSHKPRKIYNWSNWLITSVFGSLIGTPYFGRSGSLLGVDPQYWVPLPWIIGSLFGPYFKDRPQWLKKRPRYLSRGTRDSIVMSAHVFLVFLGHLIFWIGMFKGFRSNGLEILIPKHMWKSIIGPLEQI